MNFILADLRYAWRAARRSPGVTLAIIAMLALGSGGVTAVFNPIYSQVFAPLPFPQPEQLMLIGGDIPLFNGYSNSFEHREELGRIFLNLTSYIPHMEYSVTIPDTGKSKNFYVVDVNEDFFETLGIRPLRGSGFKYGEQAVVVSNRFWRNELMGADDAIGKPLPNQLVFGIPLIIGIMPETFDYPTGADIWIYRGAMNRSIASDPSRQFLGRLQSGVSPGKAEEELRNLDFKPETALLGSPGPVLQSLKKVFYGDHRPMLLMLGSMAVLFLFLVCAGVMNLLVTQGMRRRSEMAMRLILGAARRNLIFQLLRENLPLVAAGALAGLWLSEIASAWLLAQFPALKGGEVVVPVKMAFFAALVFAVTILGGLIPALYATGVDLNTYLKSGSNFKRRFFSLSLRELLVGIQFSLALALLTGVGLLVSSMMFHADVPIRWSSRDMAVVHVDFQKSPLLPEEASQQFLFFQEFQNRLSAMPEVANAEIFKPIPFSADAERMIRSGRGVYKTPRTEQERVFIQAFKGYVSPKGFDMLDIPLIAGRPFSQTDMDNALAIELEFLDSMVTNGRVPASYRIEGVAIVNQSFVRQCWPGENAIGKIIYDDWSRNSYEVVGVVPDFHLTGNNKDFVTAVYYPADNFHRTQTYLVKLHSRALINDFRQRLSSFDAGSVTIEIQSLGDITSESMASTRMTLQLLGCFAMLGIIVAGLGIYATTSLMIAAMYREMGIRMAMGAQTSDILRLALWRGTRAIFLGLPLGLFLAWVLSRILSSYLFQVMIDDPIAWIISCALLLVITIIAALIPAIRATRVNPMDALRSE